MSGLVASYLSAPRTITFGECPDCRPGAGEALVELSAVGVCGSDVHWYLDGHIGPIHVTEPLTLGHEPAGIVREVGEGVDRALIGRRVAIEPAINCGRCKFCLEGHTNLCPETRFMGTPPTQGAFRQQVVHPARLLVPLPDSVSDEVGALLEPLAIGVHVADLLHLRAGKNIVILGAGTIGLCSLLAARLSGPDKLIVIEPLEYRREIAKSMGADLVLSPEDPDMVAAVRRATGGYGADYVIEAAGTRDSYFQMAELAQPGARIAVIGIDPSDYFGFNNSTARRKGLTFLMVRRSRHTLERAVEITARGHWRPEPIITHRRPLGQLASAFDMVAGYQDGVVKTIIDPRA